MPLMSDIDPYECLDYLHPRESSANPELVERLWSRLDSALNRPLVVSDSGTERTVEALSLLAFRVDRSAHRIQSFAIQEDGSQREFGRGITGVGIFQRGWWLRFAVNQWAPEWASSDYVAEPLQRPSNIELASDAVIYWRLRLDVRYRTFRDEFDAALGVPQAVITLVDDAWSSLAQVSPESVCESWSEIENLFPSLLR